jgi:agmatinase
MDKKIYFDLPPPSSDENSKVAIIPVPFEVSVSYGEGTANAPAAILEASHQVEFYDEELGCEPCDVGISTENPVSVEGEPATVLERIESKVADITKKGKLPLVLGGEHSITPAAVRGVASIDKDLTVVQLDAHADLRQEYDGTPLSHACAMARVRESFPAVQIGIRSLSTPEAEWIRKDGLSVFFAKEIHRNPNWMEQAIDSIKTKNVYVTIDVDAFDISIMPHTGTPEPGGLDWYQVTDFLGNLLQKKRAIGFDIVELAPREGGHASDFLVAKLAYKCIGYSRHWLV